MIPDIFILGDIHGVTVVCTFFEHNRLFGFLVKSIHKLYTLLFFFIDIFSSNEKRTFLNTCCYKGEPVNVQLSDFHSTLLVKDFVFMYPKKKSQLYSRASEIKGRILILFLLIAVQLLL